MTLEGVYGAPPAALAEASVGAVQLSPTIPGSAALEDLAAESLSVLTMAAPAGTLERRHVLALGLRALAADGVFSVSAPKDRGGSRLRKELEGFGCKVEERAKQHQRLCVCTRPAELVGLDQAIAEGGPRRVEALGLWSQPGVFSWDRADPGTERLIQALPELAGRGADLGCGLGALSLEVLKSAKVVSLACIDIDRRAVEAARRNVVDPRVTLVWGDVRRSEAALDPGGQDSGGLDFVVMNPPFHDQGREDQGLGADFIRRAAALLRKGGVCWLVANRKLAYEAVLEAAFAKVTPRGEGGGYKVYEARK